MNDTNQTSLFIDAWNKLSRVDVSDHLAVAEVKKDGRVVYTYEYLSWSWCWATLMSHYPESIYEFADDFFYADGSVMVNVTVTIIEGDRNCSRSIHLPVMNQSNNAIINPDSRNISDSRMRALVKCLAIFGLGLDLWARSDIPVGMSSDPIDDDQIELLMRLYNKLSEHEQKGFMVWAKVKSFADLPKSRYQSARKLLEGKLRSQSRIEQ